MLRKSRYALIAVALLAGCCLAWALTRSSADQGENNPNGKTAALPIAQVVLFNSGVGYFQREGEVNGDTHVDLTFPTSDVNDLLKSLVLQDSGGGRIGAINYDSQDPVDKILRSFALDLNNNPTFGQILNQARGEKIEVQRQDKPGANPSKVTGTIIGMETHHQAVDKGTVEVEQLNLLAGDGMLSIPLTQVLSVHFLNPTLESEFHRALKILAGAHDVQKKTVGLHFTGNGKRPVRVGYVVERPIWKTTYRLVLEPNGKLFMQGWAIVENTSDDDWNSVRMVLVSGRPISYRMDLYAPLYIPRPLVEPELFASLRPPVYAGTFEAERLMDRGERGAQEPGIRVPATLVPAPSLGSSMAKGKGGGKGAGSENKFGLPQVQLELDRKLGENQAWNEMLQRKEQLRARDGEARAAGGAIAGMNFKEGIQSVATAGDVGDYFQYVIDQKISLPRQKSAMLPILNQTIEGGKISIYNEAVQSKYPLLGIRLKNTSGKPLTQGPITVYDDSSYAGDTRTLDLQPNEERLLSYALDQSTEVKTTIKTFPAPDMNLRIGGDNLTAVYTMRQTKTYTFKNRGTHDRSVIIEHPIRGDWKLVDPKKPMERTRDVYRFEIAVKSGETVQQEVVEEQTRTDPLARIVQANNPPYYQIVSGIDIKPLVTHAATELLALQIVKGVLKATYKDRESKSYFIHNMSDRDHKFKVDHIIRKEWKRIDKDGKDQAGPDIFRFEIDVKSKQTGQQEVVEQHVREDRSQIVANLSTDTLREFIAHAAPTVKVKEALQQVLDKTVSLKETTQTLADAKEALKILAEDQARVRENLKIVPQSSEAYKDFLKKFVAQEERIDESQKQIRATEALLLRKQTEYQAFVSSLTVQ